jgi:DNA-binding beta-propeller fold protein YncE
MVIKAMAAIFLCLTLLIMTSFSTIAYGEQIVTRWGGPGVSGNSQFDFIAPSGIAVNPSTGNIYVADTTHARIQEFTSNGQFIRAWGTFCEIITTQGCIDEDGPDGPLALGDGQFNRPSGIAVNPSTGNIYVADAFNLRIQEFTSNGQFIRAFGTQGDIGNGKLGASFGVAIP